MYANPKAKTAKKTRESTQEMKNDKFRVPRIAGRSADESVGVGQWKAIDFPASERVRPPFADRGSHCAEENPMIASVSDFAALVAALTDHTRAIGALVATLAPEVPDHVGTDYISRRLGCSTQWVAKMAENGDIPKACIAPKVSGGRIWKFHREKIEAWLREREEG
jgi:hypothetical protein